VGHFSLVPQGMGGDPQMTQRVTDVGCCFFSPVQSETPADTALSNGFMEVVWAVGFTS
jgi:hypothetical protein